MNSGRVLACVMLFIVGVAAQAADIAPPLTAIGERDVQIGMLTQTVVSLQSQLDSLRHDCNALQLRMELEKRTPPPKDGYIWSWKSKADGQPEGYVKAKAAETP